MVESSLIPIQDLYFEHRMYLPLLGVLVIFSCISEGVVKMIALPKKYIIALYISILCVFFIFSHTAD